MALSLPARRSRWSRRGGVVLRSLARWGPSVDFVDGAWLIFVGATMAPSSLASGVHLVPGDRAATRGGRNPNTAEAVNSSSVYN